MHSRFFATAISSGIAALVLSGCGSAPKVQSASGPPPVPVSVAQAGQQTVPIEIRVIGTVDPSSTVQVKSQISGELLSVHFVEGGDIKKGDLLFTIDPRPYQEALKQAEAALQKDLAQLRQAEANLGRDTAQEKNARADSERYTELAKQGVISRSQSEQYRTSADALQQSLHADQAAIESARASVASDRSAVDRAKLDLIYCEIRAPFSGRAGNLLVHAGNLVMANGPSPLVVINQIAPIFVSFGVPEEQLPVIRERSKNNKLPVDVSLQNNPGKATRGVLSVIDNTVDPNTGTIKLKATFSNEDHILWPGTFVNVALVLDSRDNAILVPSEAIQAGQNGQFIYVVKPDQTVESRKVVVGAAVGRKVVVQSGIANGETVVTDGQLRLFPGAHIQAVAADKVDSQAL